MTSQDSFSICWESLISSRFACQHIILEHKNDILNKITRMVADKQARGSTAVTEHHLYFQNYLLALNILLLLLIFQIGSWE